MHYIARYFQMGILKLESVSLNKFCCKFFCLVQIYEQIYIMFSSLVIFELIFTYLTLFELMIVHFANCDYALLHLPFYLAWSVSHKIDCLVLNGIGYYANNAILFS